MSAPSVVRPVGPAGAPDGPDPEVAGAAGDVDPTAPARPRSSLQWPAVVALTTALAFAGLVATGVFDPMIEAL
ncbi:hypothetical protein EQW78_04590 [Oerskovia turbata]|uniref:Uncharacterized protein n=1 Tax=Oerskovia turbata TaxID=1713 RepID=A0A4Q1L1U6_9CELL|nr:hypothetical protein [Oerskovia turbata]RXR27951.1 hypothetical protein EQW73_01165 [Oerskovia turbata]RXR36040.1 hypothetical protein EQW78_04590 [Oerskovia turbata]